MDYSETHGLTVAAKIAVEHLASEKIEPPIVGSEPILGYVYWAMFN